MLTKEVEIDGLVRPDFVNNNIFPCWFSLSQCGLFPICDNYSVFFTDEILFCYSD